MTVWLNADQVGERIGVGKRTAMTLMLEMNPVCIGGTVKRRMRVSEESLDRWMIAHSIGKKAPISRIGAGTNRKLTRR